ncbi:elongation factor 1-gamma isoform X1 [Rosa chinensis]|uniref:elongation factor 1-gamma isoform X1 n=1 Tax=Rosa chinensis TaxID=74649 RepID=UPI000D096C48|nr:elongation factor 1-gamma isoform X1 [Rosa chinensis]
MVKDFEMGLSNKTPEFLKMNPIGKVPVLETPDGPVFESNAIARYVTHLKADNPLYGSSLIEYALVEQWIDFATLEIDANILRWFIPRIGFAVYLPPASGTCMIQRVTLFGFAITNTMMHEKTVSFVTLNKVGGFLQRMDLARRYAFGKMLVIGSDPPFKGKGLWLFRGQEVPQFIIDECYDMELYDWHKVDITDEDQKEHVNQMIEVQEPFEGEALLDAKCFK